MKKVFSNVVLLCSFFTFLLVVGIKLTVNAKPVEFTLSTKIDMGINLREEKSDEAFLMDSLAIIKENAAKVDFTGSANIMADSNEGYFTHDGGSKYFLGYNLEFIEFTLRSEGPNVEVWVANDLGYGYDAPADIVTQVQVDMLRDEFENNIYPTTTAFFGNEDYHDGTNALLDEIVGFPEDYYASSEGKKIILVENIKDDSYYEYMDIYVAGFYWRTLEYYIDRNIVTIDSLAWFALMPNDNPNWQDYQYDIFGTLAHEFQHLIHDDNDPIEETWLDEGMSDFSQFLCGYGHNWTHIEWYQYYPDNSLLAWGDDPRTGRLSDYGQAYLLQLYIHDHYGREFIRTLATNPNQGIESINQVLEQFNTGIDFNELFRRFTIACAIDEIGGGIYSFTSLDMRIEFWAAEITNRSGAGAYSPQYDTLDVNSKIWSINFTGQDYLPMKWQASDGMFWSNEGDALDNTLIFEADLTNLENATLEFDHAFIIEESWDYGFVQVSTDNGATWVTLSNENTRDDFLNWDEYPEIGDSLPGFTGYNPYSHERFDLSHFAGQKIHIAFRYMTDGASFEDGWFIDNIAIPELGYYNNCDTLAGFIDQDRLVENYLDYRVIFINEKVLPNGKINYKIISVDPINMTPEYELQLRQLFKDGTNYMISYYESENNDTTVLPFDYEIITKK